MTDEAITPGDPPKPDGRTRPASALEISSETLLCGRKEVLIRHGDDLYRLRLTRNGKLILQK